MCYNLQSNIFQCENFEELSIAEFRKWITSPPEISKLYQTVKYICSSKKLLKSERRNVLY